MWPWIRRWQGETRTARSQLLSRSATEWSYTKLCKIKAVLFGMHEPPQMALSTHLYSVGARPVPDSRASHVHFQYTDES